MADKMDISANEVETLVYKAARGGGIALGCAEDIAMAARYMDLDQLTQCPCRGDDPVCVSIQTALDFVVAGEGPQTVEGDGALIASYVAAAQVAWQQRLIWTSSKAGATFERFEKMPPKQSSAKGRRAIKPELSAHLAEMAAKLLVPETEASRAAGAGAGMTDND
jgi:hypothetical protein